MDALTTARTAFETAELAHDTARATMLAHTRASGTYRHDAAELKAVDKLHKAMNKAYLTWWKLSHQAAA